MQLEGHMELQAKLSNSQVENAAIYHSVNYISQIHVHGSTQTLLSSHWYDEMKSLPGVGDPK